jgi:t-SNARE complex subunit (syntaxin)
MIRKLISWILESIARYVNKANNSLNKEIPTGKNTVKQRIKGVAVNISSSNKSRKPKFNLFLILLIVLLTLLSLFYLFPEQFLRIYS